MPSNLIKRHSILPARPRIALAVMACAFGMAQPARAGDCAGAAPGGAAGTAALYGELASSVSAEPLAVAIAQRTSGGTCTWVYEVRVLTVSGSVAVLDFDLVDLDLKSVVGPQSDPDVAMLRARLADKDEGGESDPDAAENDSGDDNGGDSGDDKSGNGDSGSDGGEGGDSGGNSGSGGGDSDGGGEGSDGGNDGGGGEGGDGGNDGGGEGGEGGSDD